MTAADEGWEARMSARSKARGEDWQSSWSAQVDRHMAELERQGWAAQRDMTLGQAMVLAQVEPFACACFGGTHCCRFRYGHALALQRAAHIVAKLLTYRCRAMAGAKSFEAGIPSIKLERP